MRQPKKREPIGHHLVQQLVDGRVIASSDAERRIVARVIFEISQEKRLLAFGLADTHLHTEYAESWRSCGRLAQRIGTSLSRRLGLEVPFASVHREPIWKQGHLYRTFYYDLRQQDRHGTTNDPFHDASNLPDLLGLRVLGRQVNKTVDDLLPRWNRSELLNILGVEALTMPANVAWELLPAATAAAACLPNLAGQSDGMVEARAAAIHAAHDALDATELGLLLGRSAHRIRELGKRSVDEPLVEAIRLQLVLRQLKRGV